MGLYDELRKELGDGYSLDFRNAMWLLCHVIDEQQAKIERLEKESMICCGDGTVEEWRCGADRKIEEYESPPAEARHEDDPMVAFDIETARFDSNGATGYASGRPGVWALHEVDYAALELRMMASLLQDVSPTGEITKLAQDRFHEHQGKPKCLQCGESYPIMFSQAGERFCSDACRNLAKAPKPVATCTVCGEPNEYQDGPFTCHGCRNP